MNGTQRIPSVAGSDRPLTKRQREFVEHILTTGNSPIKAAEQLGTQPSNIYRELRKPHVKRYLQERVAEHVGFLALYAARVQGELLNADSEHVRLNASEAILNRHLGRPIERKQIAFQGAINVSIDLG